MHTQTPRSVQYDLLIFYENIMCADRAIGLLNATALQNSISHLCRCLSCSPLFLLLFITLHFRCISNGAGGTELEYRPRHELIMKICKALYSISLYFLPFVLSSLGRFIIRVRVNVRLIGLCDDGIFKYSLNLNRSERAEWGEYFLFQNTAIGSRNGSIFGLLLMFLRLFH